LHDRPQHPPPSVHAGVGVDESGSGETTNVHAEGCNDVGTSGLKSVLNASASEYVVERPEELLVAEETSEPPKTGLADHANPSVAHESSTCSDSLAKFADLSHHVKCSPKTELVGALSNTPVKFGTLMKFQVYHYPQIHAEIIVLPQTAMVKMVHISEMNKRMKVNSNWRRTLVQ